MYRVELKVKGQRRYHLREFLFLMYRVELKDYFPYGFLFDHGFHVPNVPCGVERFKRSWTMMIFSMFLMYRVELKVILASSGKVSKNCS